MKTTIVDEGIARKISELLLSIGAVSINTKEPYRFVSGILSPMYTDNRLIISYPKQWHQLIDRNIRVIKKIESLKKIDVFSGTDTAAVPHAAAIAYTLHKPMVYVRSSRKVHGKKNQIEGTFTKNNHVMIIEDLISTGLSTKTNCVAIRSAGGIVHTCVAITTSTLSSFEPIMKELKIRLVTLTNVQTTLDVAVSSKRITKNQKKIVESFLDNPAGWGKKMGFE